MPNKSHRSFDPRLPRCQWPGKVETNSLMVEYHDTEWGVPVHEDRRHFEYLVLDAFQAGLSWSTVLNKRENFRAAFDHFDPERIARYTRRKVTALLGNPGIIRNRLKIEATINNARLFLELQAREGSFDAFVWQFVDGQTRHNRWRTLKQLPASTAQSDAMSKVLRERGFKFTGSTICYAYMQAAGLVNDHVTSCFRHEQIRNLPRQD
ncbi:MAG: DNA-3-methyladenine glycosylase I [Gammaproteobacteria bacterium]|nr:DNA-3-methyladenine glycosylase I [Gammaproteobacteria bacterium]